jgi:hypothetical protein
MATPNKYEKRCAKVVALLTLLGLTPAGAIVWAKATIGLNETSAIMNFFIMIVNCF